MSETIQAKDRQIKVLRESNHQVNTLKYRFPLLFPEVTPQDNTVKIKIKPSKSKILRFFLHIRSFVIRR